MKNPRVKIYRIKTGSRKRQYLRTSKLRNVWPLVIGDFSMHGYSLIFKFV
jgi:hypothetical protein